MLHKSYALHAVSLFNTCLVGKHHVRWNPVDE